MCHRVQCQRCDRPTFSGCGLHVEQVLAGVPPEERCRCRELPEPPPPTGPSLLRRLLDRLPWFRA